MICVFRRSTKKGQHDGERTLVPRTALYPILLRPTSWEDLPFHTIQLLPTGAKPITTSHNRDETFHNIVEGVRTAIEALLLARKTQQEEWLKEDTNLSALNYYEEALKIYNQIFHG